MSAFFRSRRSGISRHAFTLVELLVVIGIIAVLISILLPALGAARRQAQAVKCEAALREIGNCFQMYAMENNGYAPPAKTLSVYRITYNSKPPLDSNAIQYWSHFLAKYATRAKMGTSTPSAQERADAMKSILWGCPSFAGYLNNFYVGGTNVDQTGYGMNAFPEYSATFPPQAGPPNAIGDTRDPNLIAVVNTTNNWRTISTGKWYKLKQWTRASERALVADTRVWVLEAMAAPMSGVIPGQATYTDQVFWTSTTTGETAYDFYRHGTYPKVNGNKFSAIGGKVSYNVLFADGHVSNLVSREDGYKAARMRFPG